jgi:hypothetical protein
VAWAFVYPVIATSALAFWATTDELRAISFERDFTDEEITRIVAAVEGVSERTAANIVKKYRISVKRQNDARA